MAYITFVVFALFLLSLQVLSVATKDETLHCEILYEEVTALRILFILLDLDNQFACLFCLPYMSSFSSCFISFP